MNRLKTDFRHISYDDKLPSGCFRCTVDLPSDSLLSVVVKRYCRDIGCYELKGIEIAINSFETCCVGEKNNTNRYEVLIVEVWHRENPLEFNNNYKYLCTTYCDKRNFMVFYRLLE